MRHKKLLLLFFVLLFSCGKSKKQKDDLILNAEDMYADAKESFMKGEYSFAADKFEKIEEKYPFTKDGNKATIMAAYAYYKGNKFDDSLRIIEYYKKINFEIKDLEYIYFLEVANYLGKVKKYRKDLFLQKNTLKIIDEMNLNFPNSKYTAYLLKNREEVLDLIISNELKIVEFYIQNNNVIGAINHLKLLESNYLINKKFSGEINYRFFEIYKHLGYKEGVVKYFNLLKKYDGESKWYKYANDKL